MIRLGGSALILSVLFWLLPMDALAGAIRRVSPVEFLIVLATFLAVHAMASLKWWWLLDRRLPVGLALRAHYAGLAANLCLPGSIGGDAVRAGLAHGAMRDLPWVAAAGTFDRLIDMLALALLMTVGLVQLHGTVADGWPVAGAALLALLLLTSGLVVLPRIAPAIWTIAPRLPGRAAVEKLTEAFGGLGRRPGRLLLSLVASFAIQGALVLLSWRLAVSAGAEVGFVPWLFAWPLAKIVSVVPVSLNGLGLREGVLAATLAPFGAAPALIVAAGLLWQGVLFAGGAVGALVYALSSGRARSPSPQLAE